MHGMYGTICDDSSKSWGKLTTFSTYRGTTILFSWDFCYMFLYKRHYLVAVSEIDKQTE
jgi:hypothetical protein